MYILCTYKDFNKKNLSKIEDLAFNYVAMIFLCKDFGYRFFSKGTGFCFGVVHYIIWFLPENL